MSEKTDVVITWVDGSDPQWLRKMEQYRESADAAKDTRTRRYRDWGTLRYLLRSIDVCLPWVNHIYLVTPGMRPDWLDDGGGKLTVIDQNTLLPKECLPTFNNCAVELLLDRIPGLADRFIYMNDDMFFLTPCEETDFFRNGKPCDTIAFSAIQAVYTPDGRSVFGIAARNTMIAAKHFCKKDVFRRYWKKFLDLRNGREIIKTLCTLPFREITGFNEMHTAYSYLKDTYREVWETAGEDLRPTISSRFRDEFSAAHWCMRYWQICSGNVEIRRRDFSRFFDVHASEDAERAADCIQRKKAHVICVNDNIDSETGFWETAGIVLKALENRFPEPCRFEVSQQAEG